MLITITLILVMCNNKDNDSKTNDNKIEKKNYEKIRYIYKIEAADPRLLHQ